MRKITTFALVALLAVAFTSCKKDYVCNCNYSTISGTQLNNEIPMGKETKKKAKADCDDYQENYNNTYPGTSNVSCTLEQRRL